MQIVTTCTLEVNLMLKNHSLSKLRTVLNMAIVGQEHVNKLNKKGEMVSIFPEDKMKILEDAHHRLSMGRRVSITFDVTDAGEWTNYKIVEAP